MPKPSTLSRTAMAVLEAAAARGDHIAFPPEHLPAAAKRAVVKSLLKAGLLEEVAAFDEGAAWRITGSGERLALRATPAGLAAVGVDGATSARSQPASEVPILADRDQPAPEVSCTARDVEISVPGRPAQPGLRAAAQALLAAWDDSDASRPALPGAVEALRATLAPKPGTPSRTPSDTPRQPRPDTKRATVLALLRRPEGVTVAQVAEATGWATHTVRGFFAGLKKAGIPVDVLERVRQIGPGKEGAKGSFTVYRVTEAG